MATSPAPKPIDPRGPRFNQAMIATLLFVGFVIDWEPIVAAVAIILALGAALGHRFGPFLALYAYVIRPRLGPPAELEDPRPPRFAATLGVVVLAAAALAFLAGAEVVGWVLALLVAFLAGLSASTGICVGCEIYLFVARRRGVQMAS
jgi:Domain of unknown function (DUF4395)